MLWIWLPNLVPFSSSGFQWPAFVVLTASLNVPCCCSKHSLQNESALLYRWSCQHDLTETSKLIRNCTTINIDNKMKSFNCVAFIKQAQNMDALIQMRIQYNLCLNQHHINISYHSIIDNDNGYGIFSPSLVQVSNACRVMQPTSSFISLFFISRVPPPSKKPVFPITILIFTSSWQSPTPKVTKFLPAPVLFHQTPWLMLGRFLFFAMTMIFVFMPRSLDVLFNLSIILWSSLLLQASTAWLSAKCTAYGWYQFPSNIYSSFFSISYEFSMQILKNSGDI